MRSERPLASGEEVSQAVREIRAYHDQGRQSLKELPLRGPHGAGAIDAQAEELGWNATKLRKARQFAHRQDGYTRKQLDELCRLLREHRPRFGTSHVGSNSRRSQVKLHFARLPECRNVGAEVSALESMGSTGVRAAQQIRPPIPGCRT
jgi:hypothetical protein